MTVSALVITRDSESRLEELLLQFIAIRADEIVVCIDNRTVDKTEEIARRITDCVYLMDFKEKQYVEAVLNEAVDKCNCEWVLRLDDDERIGGGFYNIHTRLSETLYCGIAFPTYYCVDKWRFINAEPWYPDYHLRLFRKDAYKPHRGRVHVPMQVEGPEVFWDDFPLFHMTYLYNSREVREQKLIKYEDRYPTLRDKLSALIVYEAYEELWSGKISDCFDQPIHPDRVVEAKWLAG